MTIHGNFDRVLIAPPKRTQGQTNNKKNKEGRKYKLNYGDDDVSRLLLEWYESDLSINKFVVTPNFPLPRSTFLYHLKSSHLSEMKEEGESVERARFFVLLYMDLLQQNRKGRTKNTSDTNRYLTDDEEEYIYQLVRVLGSMGHGLGRKEILDLIDEIFFLTRPTFLILTAHETFSTVSWQSIRISKMWWACHFVLNVPTRQLLTREMQCSRSWTLL